MAEGKTIKMKWMILIRQHSSESHMHFKGVGGLLSQPWKAGTECKKGLEVRSWSFGKVQVWVSWKGVKYRCSTAHSDQPDYSVLKSYENKHSVRTILQIFES